MAMFDKLGPMRFKSFNYVPAAWCILSSYPRFNHYLDLDTSNPPHATQIINQLVLLSSMLLFSFIRDQKHHGLACDNALCLPQYFYSWVAGSTTIVYPYHPLVFLFSCYQLSQVNPECEKKILMSDYCGWWIWCSARSFPSTTKSKQWAGTMVVRGSWRQHSTMLVVVNPN